MKSIWLLFFVSLCLKTGNAHAQISSDQWPYTINNYTDDNGLPQNSVKSIAADASGFIWLATESGLVRFDGHSFYTFNKSNTGMSSTRLYTIQPDITGKKKRFYPISDNFKFLRVESSIAVSDSSYYPKTLRGIPHLGQDYGITFLASGSPNYLLEIASPTYYIMLSPAGIGKFFILQSNKIECFDNHKKSWEVPATIKSYDDFFSLNGKLYQFSGSGEILKYGPRSVEKMALHGEILLDPAFVSGKKTFKTFWNNVSDQAFILLGNNFYCLEETADGSWTTHFIVNGFDFDRNNIRTVHFDPVKRRLFLGSVTSGLFVLQRKDFQTLRYGNKDMDNIFYGQTTHKNNRILTSNGTILGLEKTPFHDARPDRLFQKPVSGIAATYKLDGRSILTDRDGNIWTKSFEWLHKYDSEGLKLIKSWFLGNEIKTIYQGKSGRIWLGMKSRGLFYIDPSEAEPKPVVFPGRAIPEVSFLLQDRDDVLWVASQRGLYNLNLKSGAATVIKGTEKLSIRSLYISPTARNGVFLMTYEDGFFLYRDGKLVQFPLDSRKNLSVTHCMVEDTKGFMWVPTNNGLFQVSKNDLFNYAKGASSYGQNLRPPDEPLPNIFYMYYAKERGFYTNEFNGGCQPCAVKLPNGYVSLPSLNGLVWFEPEKIKSDMPDGGLTVDRVSIGDSVRIIRSDTIRLPLNPKQIGFHVTTPYFGSLNNLHLSYAISAPDKKLTAADWISLPSVDLVVRFSELNYGDYLLSIRKANGFGQNNYTVKKILIHVPRNWYETWWLRTILGLGFLAALYFYVRFRVRKLQKQNQELELVIKRRTDALQQTLVALQGSEKELNRQMHIQTRLIASISHDVRTPLRFITSAAERIEAFVGRGEFGKIGAVANNVKTSGKRMNQLLENTIGYIKTQVYGTDVRKEEALLLPIIEEKTELFGPVMKEQSNQFVINVDPEIAVRTNAQLLGIVIHNLVDNACKYTFEGVVTISAKILDQALHLTIADSGPGIPKHFMAWLNNSSTDESVSLSGDYDGLGLLIVKEISQLINLRLLVENQNGTVFHLIFPIEKLES